MGSITLSSIAARAVTLAVACNRCRWTGCYPLDTLIAEHGAECDIPALLDRLSADCPNRASLSVYDSCGVRCPELPALFMRDRQPS